MSFMDTLQEGLIVALMEKLRSLLWRDQLVPPPRRQVDAMALHLPEAAALVNIEQPGVLPS